MTPVRSRRPGAIAPMAAIFSVFLLGMVAFAVDTSWIVLSQSELQNAADAAALAGAQQLYNDYVKSTTVSGNALDTLIRATITTAVTKAKDYASYNGAGGVASLTLNDSDISIGFTDGNGVFTAYSSGGGFPNTVKVTMRRDAGANAKLGLFFAPVLGTSEVALTARSACTLYLGLVNSFKGATDGLLPLTYDVNHWKNYLSTGQDPDGGTSSASDGSSQLQVYPEPSNKVRGNFGLLSLNDSHVGASTMEEWIRNGPSAEDIRALQSGGLLPLDQHDSSRWDWNGENGFKASNVQDVNRRTGAIFWLPLFNAKEQGSSYEPGVGSGSNYDYQIVAFVPVKVMPVSDTNRDIVVQPATRSDASAVFTNITAAGNQSGSNSFAFTPIPPRLSQ